MFRSLLFYQENKPIHPPVQIRQLEVLINTSGLFPKLLLQNTFATGVQEECKQVARPIISLEVNGTPIKRSNQADTNQDSVTAVFQMFSETYFIALLSCNMRKCVTKRHLFERKQYPSPFFFCCTAHFYKKTVFPAVNVLFKLLLFVFI